MAYSTQKTVWVVKFIPDFEEERVFCTNSPPNLLGIKIHT